jgi:hypothetical protein
LYGPTIDQKMSYLSVLETKRKGCEGRGRSRSTRMEVGEKRNHATLGFRFGLSPMSPRRCHGWWWMVRLRWRKCEEEEKRIEFGGRRCNNQGEEEEAVVEKGYMKILGFSNLRYHLPTNLIVVAWYYLIFLI